MKTLARTLALLFAMLSQAEANAPVGCDALNSAGLSHNQWEYTEVRDRMSNALRRHVRLYTRRTQTIRSPSDFVQCNLFSVIIACTDSDYILLISNDRMPIANNRDFRVEYSVDERRSSIGPRVQWRAGDDFTYVSLLSHKFEIINEWSRGNRVEVNIVSPAFGVTRMTIPLNGLRAAINRLGACGNRAPTTSPPSNSPLTITPR